MLPLTKVKTFPIPADKVDHDIETLTDMMCRIPCAYVHDLLPIIEKALKVGDKLEILQAAKDGNGVPSHLIEACSDVDDELKRIFTGFYNYCMIEYRNAKIKSDRELFLPEKEKLENHTRMIACLINEWYNMLNSMIRMCMQDIADHGNATIAGGGKFEVVKNNKNADLPRELAFHVYRLKYQHVQ